MLPWPKSDTSVRYSSYTDCQGYLQQNHRSNIYTMDTRISSSLDKSLHELLKKCCNSVTCKRKHVMPELCRRQMSRKILPELQVGNNTENSKKELIVVYWSRNLLTLGLDRSLPPCITSNDIVMGDILHSSTHRTTV